MEELLYRKLKDKAKSILGAISFVLLIVILLTVSMLLEYFSIINAAETINEDKSDYLLIAIIMPIVSIVVSLIIMIPYFMDYKSIKNKSYITLNVIVSHFDFYETYYEPIEKNYYPVFKDIDSKKLLNLVIDEKVNIGEKYSVAYLPKTKIAVLKIVNN
jgi:heme/copper-type cytochrome/quinol oxidase subunit 2